MIAAAVFMPSYSKVGKEKVRRGEPLPDALSHDDNTHEH